MSKKIIINASFTDDTRIAVIDNDRLVDINIEQSNKKKYRGNIYKAFVFNIEQSLNAAFVEFGKKRQAFLPFNEIRPSLYSDKLNKNENLKINNVLKKGQSIIIQITKDEINNKGAAASTYLSIPGRLIVLMHSNKHIGGISRKIKTNAARNVARSLLISLKMPNGLATIIRTAGTNSNRQDLFYDFKMLCSLWRDINKYACTHIAPILLYQEPNLVLKTIRDYSKDISKILIDDHFEYKHIYKYFSNYMPDMVFFLKHYTKAEPIFNFFGIEKAILELFKRDVKLISGGYITIEQTEALVSIDVNSGQYTKMSNHKFSIFKTNIEASKEIARQLRLRDLGGIILIDFIDMNSFIYLKKVENHLVRCMQADKSRIKLGRIGKNGTLELTRQRLRQSHRLISHIPCYRCKGTGRMKNPDGIAIDIFRQINGYLTKKRLNMTHLIIYLPFEISNILNNKKRYSLIRLSYLYNIQINILGKHNLSIDSIEFEEHDENSYNNNLNSSSNLLYKHILHFKKINLHKKYIKRNKIKKQTFQLKIWNKIYLINNFSYFFIKCFSLFFKNINKQNTLYYKSFVFLTSRKIWKNPPKIRLLSKRNKRNKSNKIVKFFIKHSFKLKHKI